MYKGWIAIFGALALTPGAVSAAENLGTSSSGSITVRVVVPPLAAALQAKSEGAVGLYSVVDTKSAVMVTLPATLSEAATSAALFHGSDLPVTLTSASQDQLRLIPREAQRLNGMVRQSFNLLPTFADHPRAEDAAGMTLIVAPV